MKIIEWILSHFNKEHERLQDSVPDEVIERHKKNDYRQMAIEKQEALRARERIKDALHRCNALQYAQYRIIRKYVGYTDKKIKMLKEHGYVPADIVEFNNEVKIKLHTKKQKTKNK